MVSICQQKYGDSCASKSGTDWVPSRTWLLQLRRIMEMDAPFDRVFSGLDKDRGLFSWYLEQKIELGDLV